MHNIDKALQKAQTQWLKQMEDYKDSLGCIQLPTTPMLTERHLENCKVLPCREAILQRMRVGGVVAEVGVQTGRFSRSILNICHPSKLHLIDIDLHSFSITDQFEPEINAGTIHLHEGDSSTILADFPDGYFDFIYIDGDHNYEGVKRDAEVAKHKVKEKGVLIFNDYTYWSPVECMRYGIIQAVNNLCIEEDWEVIYFALAHYMYCDVAIRRR
ncbi:MAG TPA: class I SAM-dependent methyltransferase [Leptolyngbyaceae cyanobacterium]